MATKINGNLLDLIGNTPIVKLQNFDTGPCDLYIKLESHNPGGSIKDRIAFAMVTAAEQSGELKPGGTLVEATAGNTGLGLALIAALKGYRLLLVIPDKMSQEKIDHLQAMGAEVLLTRSDVSKGHSEYYQDYAERIAKEMDNAYYVNQFGNPANPAIHQADTAPELWEQMDHDIDAIVCGVGTSGTMTGIGHFMAEHAPNVEMILADPQGSILTDYIKTGEIHEKGTWLVEGIGEDFIPNIADMSVVKQAFQVSDTDSFQTARELLQKEAIFAGSSSGTLVFAALQYCRAQTEKKRVLTFICDSGNKYLSKVFSDDWMVDQNLMSRESHNDARDLISDKHSHHGIVCIHTEDTLLAALKRMRQHHLSYLIVIDNGKVLGQLSEQKMLAALSGLSSNFECPVNHIMDSEYNALPSTTPIEGIHEALLKHPVIVLIDKEQFAAIITPTDLNQYYLRKQNL